MTPLISAAELADRLDGSGGGPRPAVLDVRWSLGGPPGEPLHRAGHIPGAVYVDLDTDLAAKSEDPRDGRSPMPTAAALTAAARRWGLRTGEPVVVYDDTNGLAAGRAWWLLRHAGVADVRLLDGGLGAWRAAGLALESGPVGREPGDVDLAYGTMTILDMDDAARLAREGALFDARPASRYTGDEEPLEPRGGHVPGARHAFAGDHFTESGAFRPPDELRAYYAERGLAPGTPVGVYCGGGTTCAINAIALTLAGYEPAIYPGSWSQWSANPDRPVATGADPG